MRTPIDFGHDAGIKTFGNIAADVLNNNFGAVTKSPPAVKMLEAVRCAPADLADGLGEAVIIAATEGKTGFEIGLIFSVKDITVLADLMLMGDGEPKPDLDSDLKDAVRELANQFFGGLAVPMEAEMGKKFQFRVDDVVKLQGLGDFQSDSYICLEMQGELNGILNFRLYADEGFTSLLKKEAPEKQTFSTESFFSSPADKAPASSGGGASPNMDVLLDIEIPVSVRMGSAKLFLKDILGLGPGNIVELDQNADESIELTVNDKLIARGEVVIVDGYFGFRIKEIISKAERLRKLKD